MNANRADIEKYKALFDSGKFESFPNTTNPHIVAGIVKLWLLELPEPVATFGAFENFVKGILHIKKKMY